MDVAESTIEQIVSVPTDRNVSSDSQRGQGEQPSSFQFLPIGMSLQTESNFLSVVHLFQFLPIGMSLQTGSSLRSRKKKVSVPTDRNVSSDQSSVFQRMLLDSFSSYR